MGCHLELSPSDAHHNARRSGRLPEREHGGATFPPTFDRSTSHQGWLIMQSKKLGFHSHVLPTVERLRNDPSRSSEGWQMWADDLERMQVYDCRGLPLSLVDDTGALVFSEVEERVRAEGIHEAAFPAGMFDGWSGYFEFSDESSLISIESCSGDFDDNGEHVTDYDRALEIKGFCGWGIGLDGFYESIGDSYVEFGDLHLHEFDDGVKKFIRHMGGSPLPGLNEFENERALKRLLGVMTLLSDKLLATEMRPDPEPRLTAARTKRGKLPLTGASLVLTINIAAIRNAVRDRRLGTHESPCLHWRRGHQRVLHRGSEFESKTWVHRCLVGDPSRGYLEKDYRLVHQQAMLAPTGVAEMGMAQ